MITHRKIYYFYVDYLLEGLLLGLQAQQYLLQGKDGLVGWQTGSQPEGLFNLLLVAGLDFFGRDFPVLGQLGYFLGPAGGKIQRQLVS